MGMKLSPELEVKVLALASTVNGQPVVSQVPLEEGMSEKDFMALVIDEAKRHGWKIYHTFDSRKSEAGFLDLVLVRERVLYRETKTETGQLTAAQENWIEALKYAGQDVGVWRPSDWPEIVKELA